MNEDEKLIEMSQKMNPAQTKAVIYRLLDDIEMSFSKNKTITGSTKAIRDNIFKVEEPSVLRQCCLHLMKASNYSNADSANTNTLYNKSRTTKVGMELTKASDSLLKPVQLHPPTIPKR